MARLNNGTIAEQLQKSKETVHNQASTIFDEIGVRTRTEAIVHVRDRNARPCRFGAMELALPARTM